MSGTVLFAWRRTPPPFLIGGAEVSQRLLAEQFADAGWRTAYLGSHEAPWNADSHLAEMHAFLRDEEIDTDSQRDPAAIRYQWRSIACEAVTQERLEDAFTRQLDALRPDLVITCQEGSAALAEIARPWAPVVGWLHSVSETGLEVLRGRPHHALATSTFVLDRADGYPGAVLFYPPFAPHIAPHKDDAATGDLLMVNPVPAKGGELIRRLAALLPERRLTLVQGWWDTRKQFADLPNVTHLPRIYAMDGLYAHHRLLLVPSTVPDAFPRVIIEAALAGTPSLGALRGGIPEAIGDGGLLLPPNDPETWARTIRALGAAELTRLGQAARRRAAPLVRACLPELAAAGVIPD